LFFAVLSFLSPLTKETKKLSLFQKKTFPFGKNHLRNGISEDGTYQKNEKKVKKIV